MRVGWIGLGAMGAPMAEVIIAGGHDVVAFDVDAGRVSELASRGATPAGSCAEAAQGAQVLLLMVATPAQAQAALFGPEGAAAAMSPGSVVMVMSTIGLAAVEALGSRLGELGIGLVDAPVSGGAARAASGDLLIMVGGDPAQVAIARPLLDLMAASAPAVGERIGDGQRVKLVNQILCGSHVALAAEALGYAEALGLDAAATFEVIRRGAAQSFMLDDRGPRMLSFPDCEVKSALDILHKDLGLVVDAARAVDYPTPIAAAALQLYVEGRRQGLGRADDSALIEVARGAGRADMSASTTGASGSTDVPNTTTPTTRSQA